MTLGPELLEAILKPNLGLNLKKFHGRHHFILEAPCLTFLNWIKLNRRIGFLIIIMTRDEFSTESSLLIFVQVRAGSLVRIDYSHLVSSIFSISGGQCCSHQEERSYEWKCDCRGPQNERYFFPKVERELKFTSAEQNGIKPSIFYFYVQKCQSHCDSKTRSMWFSTQIKRLYSTTFWNKNI